MFALLLLAGCTATLQDTSVTEPDTDARSRQVQGQESSLIPGSMIIEVTDELADQLATGALQTKSSSVNAAFEGLGVAKIERVFPDAGEWEPRHRAAGLHRFFRVTYNPEAAPATKAAVDFSALDGVLSASPARAAKPDSAVSFSRRAASSRRIRPTPCRMPSLPLKASACSRACP